MVLRLVQVCGLIAASARAARRVPLAGKRRPASRLPEITGQGFDLLCGWRGERQRLWKSPDAVAKSEFSFTSCTHKGWEMRTEHLSYLLG